MLSISNVSMELQSGQLAEVEEAAFIIGQDQGQLTHGKKGT
jgi:hypothetical protein